MDDSSATSSSTRGPDPKVERVIRKYDLEGQGEELAARWRGDTGPRRSLRKLADHLNHAILESTMRESGLRPLDGEVENLYRLLTEDEISGAKRTEAEARLERNGIAPSELRADFVSHQAVHTYLRQHRGVRLSKMEHKDKVGDVIETVQGLSGRLRTVAEEGLERLKGDEISIGNTDVFVSVAVYCNDCGRQIEFEELLDRSGCDCNF